MKVVIRLFLGIMFISLGVYGMVTGEIGGAGKSGATNMVFRNEQPTYFWASVSIGITVGIMILYKLSALINCIKIYKASRNRCNWASPWVIISHSRPEIA